MSASEASDASDQSDEDASGLSQSTVANHTTESVQNNADRKRKKLQTSRITRQSNVPYKKEMRYFTQ